MLKKACLFFCCIRSEAVESFFFFRKCREVPKHLAQYPHLFIS
nr:MAG TPA: hypothetical protein [Caudoviricetes sp.]